MASFFRTLLLCDTYFEYGVIQRELDKIFRAKNLIDIGRNMDIQSAKGRLADCEKQKELYDNELALRRSRGDEGKNNPVRDLIEKAVEAFDRFSKAWVEARYATYKRYFSLACAINKDDTDEQK